MKKHLFFILCTLFAIWESPVCGQTKKTKTVENNLQKDSLNPEILSSFQFRSLGPAITSGRIADIAVNPKNISEYYVAAASGGVWKTVNRGITFKPVFDDAGSYSIGCIAIDPQNTNVVWVGTGENNNQRSVAYGDGIYKSEDGGKTFKNMGLKNSEHIGRIAIHPTNSDIVYVAVYGPLWNSGGDRGIYKTTDGGKNWKQILNISEHTGCNEIIIDPRYPDILYAAAHQRQRKVFAYIGGGPESALYKSTDGGTSWNKIMQGLPGGDIGRIGLNYFPGNPDILYCVVEAGEGKGGVFKSTDRGASWDKRSGYTTSGNYYQKLYCDPKDEQKIFVINTYMGVSRDGGKNFSILGEKSKHIDNHAIWINPDNTHHYLVGCDGGLYETFDDAANWHFKPNLPVTQFYKVSTDNAFPFYHIHGGTQDNFSIGGPSRTTSINGIVNSDWYFTSIGDGFETQVDPTDPNIIYAQSQYGGLLRYDRKCGEYLDIKPLEKEGEPAYRWNWDAPLVISSFNPQRLYFAANKIFRTDDRGKSWTAISGDLSRQLDRNQWKLMGKVWSADAIAKNGSTDIYGNITSLAESTLDANDLWAGTDDGLIYHTTNGGQQWIKFDQLPGVPERSYVHQIIASRFDKNTAYVCFNHHRYGDFKPYVLKTMDAGKSWISIQGNLPQRGSVYSIAEDHVLKDLLFIGTEFGVYCTVDGGKQYIQLKNGLPTIAVRDIEIQKRENDLVLGTFGRGFYVLDDYSPLRQINSKELEKTAFIFPVKNPWMYIESIPLGVRGKGFQGESFHTAENPKPEAIIRFYLKEDLKTIQQIRRDREKELTKQGKDIPYPSLDSLRMEDEQETPHLLFTISNAEGQIIRKIKTAARKGIGQITWDLRSASFSPIEFNSFDESFVFSSQETGYLVVPGIYTVQMSKFEDGKYSDLNQKQSFEVKALNTATLPATDKLALDEFSKKVGKLRIISGSISAYHSELMEKIKYIKKAIIDAPSLETNVALELKSVQEVLNSLQTRLNGDNTRAKREFETVPSINGRIGNLVYGLWSTTSAPTTTHEESYVVAYKQLQVVHSELSAAGERLKKIEQHLDASGVPYTPGRKPVWINK